MSRERETWRLCTRHDGYLVSDHGRVRRIGGKILTPCWTTRNGRRHYLKVNLGRKIQVHVHALVAEAFLGPRPAGHDVDHHDFDRANNHVGNLRYMHLTENRVRWGGSLSGGRILWLSRKDPDVDLDPATWEPLTPEQDAEIRRELVAAGWTG